MGFAAAIGAIAGAALGASWGRRAVAAGAMAGAVGLGASEAVARARQQPGEIPARWHRIAVSVAMAAPLGWAAGRVPRLGPRAVATAVGALSGAISLRPQKVALGPLVGASVGALAARSSRPVPTAAVAGGTVLAYRSLSALTFRDEQLSLLAERVDAADLPFVVPIEARTRYVGTGYLEALAGVLGGT